MQLIPAIDLRDGRCVRLLKGDFNQETGYDVDPIELAGRYSTLGAAWLHVVDLDGAATGLPVNLELIAKIRAGTELKIQLGGGIRDRTSLEAALEVADRIVVGSLAVTDPAELIDWIDEFGASRFTLGFDVRLTQDNIPFVTTHGWTRDSTLTLADAIERYAGVGLKHVLCTDVDRDGALSGPNLDLYADCATRWPELSWEACGGVRDVDDLTRLAETGAASAISGKALLEGRLTTEEMQRFLPNA